MIDLPAKKISLDTYINNIIFPSSITYIEFQDIFFDKYENFEGSVDININTVPLSPMKMREHENGYTTLVTFIPMIIINYKSFLDNN